MKIGRIPLIHLGRMRHAAVQADCEGLLAWIDIFKSEFYERKREGLSENETRAFLMQAGVAAGEEEAVDEALDKLNDAIHAKYPLEEESNDDSSLSEDDFTAIPRYFLHMAELLPQQPSEIRMPIDRFLAKMAGIEPKSSLPTIAYLSEELDKPEWRGN